MNEHGPQAFPALDDQSETMGPPIEAKTLLTQCMGSETLALMLLSELENSGRETVQIICQSMMEQDFEAAREAAHSLKGAAGIIGAERLRELAAQLENAGKQGRIREMEEYTEPLRDEMKRCLEFLPRLSNELSAKAVPELPVSR